MGARRVSRTHALAFLLSLISVGAVLVLHDGQAWPAPWPASAAFAGGASATNQELPRRRGKVYVRWGMAAGLCNQLNSHVNGLVLALALGADAAVLPWNTMYRTSFNHSKGGGSWHFAPISTLLDVDAMRREWAARGLEVHVAPRNDKETDSMPGSIPWENCTKAGAAAFAPPPGNKYLHNNLVTLVSKLRLELADVWARWGEETCIVLHAVHLFNALNANSTGNLTVAAAAGLRFNAQLEEKAAKAAMAVGHAFNGAHLRLEPDMGLDPEMAIPQYLDAMRAMNFSADKPVYIASGLLTYNDSTMFDVVANKLSSEGLCSKAVAKEHLLPAADLQGLHSEQLALLDLLTLARSAALVGHNLSTFSLFVRDYRTIRGFGTRASVRLLGDEEFDNYLPLLPAPAWP